MEKILELKFYNGGGVESTPFPNADNPIKIGAFRYDAKRMGGAPTITASVSYPTCLDDEWTDKVYALFNGEKYYLKQTPTSSYDNADTMYKHDITLVSERVALDNVYFFDVVAGNPLESDKPVSNSTKVVFFGDVREFASRLKASLEYSGLDYSVVVDDDVVSEEKLMSFEDQFFSNVLQEIYNTYEVPYYFVGKTIHIGDHNKLNEDEQLPVFAYGVDDALLSITKNNANYKIVNRATGTGSSDNIPFYYPNNSPKGVLAVGGSVAPLLKIVDGNAFANEVNIGDVVRYGSAKFSQVSFLISHDGNKYVAYNGEAIPVSIINMKSVNKWFSYTFSVTQEGRIYVGGKIAVDGNNNYSLTSFLSFAKIRNQNGEKIVSIKDGYIDCGRLQKGSWTLNLGFAFPYLGRTNYTAALSLENVSIDVWYNETQEKETSLKKMGLVLMSGGFAQGSTITQELVKYVNTSKFLMPFKYRETDGKERFYNAINDTYEGVKFNNPFVEGKPKEHIIKVDDIKPSIEGMEYKGQRIDMFEAFAYDDDDNDETYEDEEGNVYFKHPYFFAKLKPLGFNLFDHAIEQQPMVISFTSGDCGACSFEIAVDEDTQKNTVQVDESGNVKRDEYGNVLCGSEALNQSIADFQPIQQDTTNNSVWIALRKEEQTYGILMPKAPTKDENESEIGGHRPSEQDTFVILGINLPYEYIEHAEKKLEAEIIRYLKENNDEKFTFSISFSRIYFTENPDILPLLSENSKIKITYNNKEYDLYVSSYSYSMEDNDALPEIKVELDATLKVSQNALQNAISEVKSSIGSTVNEVVQELAVQKRSYVSKVEDDNAQGVVNFTKGIKFGEGGKVEVLDDNSAKLTIEYLEVTKKASFTSLEIQEKTHVGGQILITPAAINCGEVEEFEDYYRCYFQTKGVDGDEIFNQFVVEDQAICQTYNAWGSKYYWRLVVGIGEDYIDLSKAYCAEDSGIPSAGDKIIQLGNQKDKARQDAIVLAAYGEGSPYIIQYKGINKFELSDDKVITKLSSTENIFTGKVHMEMGSSIPEEVLGDLSGAIGEAIEGLEFGKYNLLRNSGFTGDFVTEALDNDSILDENTELFSNPLRHWITEGDVTVIDSELSQSGKECNLNDASLRQEMMYPIIEGENYVLSFRAKGRSLNYSVGGVTKEIILADKQERFVEKFTAISGGNMFAITNATATICEIQLERGNVVSAWGHSMWDNQSEIAKYQALNYLETAIKNGATDILGGLIMSNIMLLGNPQAGDNTAGVSGIYNDDNDVAFWGGGTYAQAIDTVMKYVEDPTYQPTTDELANMAKAVITHGGRAILNDVIVRGKVYAEEGNIGGFEITRNRIGHANNGLSLSTSYLSFRDTDDDTSATRFAAVGENVLPSTVGIYGLSRFEAESSDSFDKDFGSAIGVYSSIKGYKKPFAYYCPHGQFAGLRPRFRRIVCPANEKLEKIDHTLEVFGVNGEACTLTLPTGPEDGQIYEILKWGDSALTINALDTNIVRIGVIAQPSQGIGTDFVGIIRIVFSKGASNQWLMTLCRTE